MSQNLENSITQPHSHTTLILLECTISIFLSLLLHICTCTFLCDMCFFGSGSSYSCSLMWLGICSCVCNVGGEGTPSGGPGPSIGPSWYYGSKERGGEGGECRIFFNLDKYILHLEKYFLQLRHLAPNLIPQSILIYARKGGVVSDGLRDQESIYRPSLPHPAYICETR